MTNLKIITVLIFSFFYTFLFANEQYTNYLMDPNKIEWDAGGFYEGSFEDGTPFQMDLPYPIPESINRKESQPHTLSPSYWYPKNFSGKTIQLRIRSFSQNFVELVAETEDKNGNFVDAEVFKGTLSPDRITMYGVWKQTNKNRQLKFSMKRVYPYHGVDVTHSRNTTIDDDNPSRPFVFSVIFPIIGNQHADSWIRDLMSTCEHDLECTNQVTIAFHANTSLSLHGWAWGYSNRMAHGNGSSAYKHFKIIDTSLSPAELNHFISVSPNCLHTVSKNIVSLLEEKVDRPENGTIEDWKHIKFLPTPVGIQFDFDPYELGGYLSAATVFVKKKDIEQCVKYLPTYH